MNKLQLINYIYNQYLQLTWGNDEKKAVWNHYQAELDEYKNHFKSLIRDWAKSKGTEVDVWFDRFEVKEGRPKFYLAGVHNSKNAIESKRGWLNKVTVNNHGDIVSHKARTDPAFLQPFDTEFRDFVLNLFQTIDTE